MLEEKKAEPQRARPVTQRWEERGPDSAGKNLRGSHEDWIAFLKKGGIVKWKDCRIGRKFRSSERKRKGASCARYPNRNNLPEGRSS